MKIIKEGSAQIGKWWVGLILTCPTCGRVVELEEGDDMMADWEPTEPNQVKIYCDNCRDVGFTAQLADHDPASQSVPSVS